MLFLQYEFWHPSRVIPYSIERFASLRSFRNEEIMMMLAYISKITPYSKMESGMLPPAIDCGKSFASAIAP